MWCKLKESSSQYVWWGKFKYVNNCWVSHKNSLILYKDNNGQICYTWMTLCLSGIGCEVEYEFSERAWIEMARYVKQNGSGFLTESRVDNQIGD